MSYAYDTEPSAGSFANDSKASSVGAPSLLTGNPIGLLLTLTYASDSVFSGNFSFDSEPSAGSYSGDVKP